MKPWDKQKEVQASKERVASIEQIIDMGLGIDNKRIRCLFFLAYLTGGRICELVRKYSYDVVLIGKEVIDKKVKYNYRKIRRYNANEETINEPGIRRKDFTFPNRNNRPIMLIFLRNEKNKKRHIKDIPIPLDMEENINIYNSIIEYINSLGMNDELFPFGYQYAYKKLKEYFNPHWFRHIRATHLCVNYGFTEAELRQYLGWTDSRPAKDYVEMKWADLLPKLK